MERAEERVVPPQIELLLASVTQNITAPKARPGCVHASSGAQRLEARGGGGSQVRTQHLPPCAGEAEHVIPRASPRHEGATVGQSMGLERCVSSCSSCSSGSCRWGRAADPRHAGARPAPFGSAQAPGAGPRVKSPCERALCLRPPMSPWSPPQKRDDAECAEHPDASGHPLAPTRDAAAAATGPLQVARRAVEGRVHAGGGRARLPCTSPCRHSCLSTCMRLRRRSRREYSRELPALAPVASATRCSSGPERSRSGSFPAPRRAAGRPLRWRAFP